MRSFSRACLWSSWAWLALPCWPGLVFGVEESATRETPSKSTAPSASSAKASSAHSTGQLFFEQVRPLLAAKCQQCHGADAQEGNLRLDSRVAALQGGASGPAIARGKPGESLLLKAVEHASPDLQMPPKEKLPPAAIAALQQWIADGAPWPEPALVLFEDEESILSALREGGGDIRLEANEPYRGAASLVVAPQRLAASIPHWKFPIRETPSPGEYRYIRFAWKQRGAGAILFEVARNGAWREQPQSNAAWVAGKNTSGWGAIPVSDVAPQEWTVVTRDLWRDGQWGDFELTGLCLTALNGGEAWIDSIVLGRDLESLDAYDLGRGASAVEVPHGQHPLGDAWSDPRNPIRKIFNGERLDLWSLQKPVQADLPETLNTAWPRTPVDRFILQKLEAAQLAPAPRADRRTLIRRLSFDLTGLPPSPDEVSAFVQDESPDAYERLVERLLASPRYGERQARLWLDVVRYSDTNNFERDEFRPQMWRYRDWVIRSFNADKPYDRFLREQLAGDELVAGWPASTAEADALTATGYLRLGPWDSTASLFEEEQRGRDQLLADLVNTTGSAVLGLTLSCCNCHDHKYDPLSQADHFRLRAFFAGVKFRDDLVIDTPEVRAEIDRHNEALDQANGPDQTRIEQLRAAARLRVAEARRKSFSGPDQALLELPEQGLDAEQRKARQELQAKLVVGDPDAAAAFTEAEKSAFAAAQKAIDQRNGQRRAYQTATGMSDAGRSAPATHLFFQGDYTQPRDETPPGFLSALDPNPAQIAPLPESVASSGRRSALVDWLVSEANPLTARVMVNRLWQQHFGVGLVGAPNDFGYAGPRPTHPELLDWLAVEFRRRGWSVKEIHRLIVLSATYQQASTRRAEAARVDPENHLLARQNIQRLSAEMLRDAMLNVAGQLLPVEGGAPRWPPVPAELLEAQPAILEAMEGKDGGRGQGYPAQPLEETFVRSVFLAQKASTPLPLLQAFDLPESSVSCGRRNVTTVAPQALTLLNAPFSLAMARAFAERVATVEGEEPARQIEAATRLALSRDPTADERGLLVELHHDHARRHAERLRAVAGKEPGEEALAAAARRAALVDVCRVLLNLNEFVYVD